MIISTRLRIAFSFLAKRKKNRDHHHHRVKKSDSSRSPSSPSWSLLVLYSLCFVVSSIGIKVMRVECIEIYKNILSPNTRQDKEELDETKKISKSKKDNEQYERREIREFICAFEVFSL